MRFKLTSSQKNFYNKNFTLDSQIWNQGVMQIFPKVYSYEEINNAYNKLVETHDSLRVKLVETEDGIVADVKEHEYINYRFWQVETEEELMQKAQDFLNEPTDRYGLLVDCAIFQTPTTSGVMINAHHIVVDGFSALVMSEHINNFLKDENFTPIIQKYSEYVQKEEKYKQSRRYAKSKDFWLKEFSSNPQCQIFPTTENAIDFSSTELNHPISAELYSRIKTFCDEKEITPASFFNAVNAEYIHRMYSIENFTIGVPVFNRTTADELNTIGLYMHLVPLVINVQSDSFINNARRIEDSQMNLFRHQSFTQQDIKELLSENNFETNNLFDVVSDFQEFAPNKEYEMRIPYSNTLSVPIEMHLQTFDEGKHNLKIRYRTAYFGEKNIQIMLKSIIALAENALENPDKSISELEMISEEERETILKDFNNTAHKYNIPNNTTLYSLFEKKSEENKEKVCIIANDEEITFKDFKAYAERLDSKVRNITNSEKSVIAVICERSFEMYGAVYGIIRGGNAYLPIDPNYPQDRIDYILSNSNAKAVIAQDKFCHLAGNTVCINATEVLNSTEQPEKTEILANENDTAYVIYTSGSTGNPKGAKINHKSAINRILWMHDFYPLEENDVILQKTPYTFDVSVWELFWWGITGRTLCASKPDEHFLPAKILDETEKNKVTHLHFVPSVFDLFLTYLENNPEEQSKFNTVKYVFLSGEALTANSINRFYKMYDYNKVSLHNLYGPTECAVDVSYYPCVPTDVDPVPIGKPIYNTQLHIVDKYLNPTPIGVTGELCIAGVNVGQGYLNNEELTNEKFIDNPFGEGKLYKTGDLAYWREDGQICYVGRNDFQVKINGQRIELGEIENAISGIDGVVQCAVIVKEQYICAYYTGTEKEVKELRAELSTKLPRYMVPHSFTHLEKLPMTVSGKLDRKALPEIDLTNISAEAEYVAPSTEREKVLAEVITLVLNVEKVNMVDSFFDMGGDSLKAIELAAGLEDKGYTVVVKSIFEAKDIQSLAKKITVKTEKEEKVHYDSVIPATAAQMSVYTPQILDGTSTLYNVPYVFNVEKLDVKRLERAINELVARHESLRTSFENRDGQIVQIINESVTISVQNLETSNPDNFIKPFDLSKAPFLRVGCYNNTVMVDLHHIIADGSSAAVFFRELNELYMGRELPETVQYGEFAVTSSYTKEDADFWTREYDEVPALDLVTDFSRPETQSFKGTNIFTRIDNKLNENILSKCKELGITPYAYYMACYNILLSKYSNNEDICVGVPTSGRSSKYINTLGMFVNMLSLKNQPEGTKTFKEFANEVKDKSLEAISHQNYPQQELIKQTGGKKTIYDVMFAYQSEEMTEITFADKKVNVVPTYGDTAKCDLSFYVFPREKEIVLMTEYCTDLFKEETIEKFIEAYKSILEQCLCETRQIKDLTVLTEDEKKKILKDFNDTSEEYAREKCIHELFEEQAERTPDKVAVVAADKKVTYRELNEEANRIAHSLIEKGIGKGDIVGLMLPRKSYLLSALFGILKTGAAYLPIDSELPKERIEYMCKDTKARMVVSQDNIDTLLASDKKTNPNVEMTNESLCYCIYTSGSTGQPKGVMARHRNVVNYISRNEHNIFGKIIKEDFENIVSISTCSFDIFVTETIATLVNGLKVVLADEQECRNQYALNRLLTREKGQFLQTTPTKLKALTREPSQREFLRDVKAILLGGEAMEVSYLKELKELTNAKIYNIYGVTEVPIWSAFVDTDTFTDEITIGHGIANTQMYVVDKYLNLVPIGVMGELCIAGESVSSGYLNQPELTAEKFIDNPFGSGKLYKTGDHAYWREDGNLVFIGRKDFQVKIRGLRIELGEIESVIQAIEGIERAVVVVRKDNEDRQLICAFYTGKEIDVKELRTILSTKLPKYMVPHIFTHLDKMPMTASGKANRKALPEIDLTNISTEAEYVAPSTEREKVLAEAIEKVLNAEKVGTHDNFFDMGGDSLKAIELVSKIEDKGYTVNVKDIFEAKDIQTLAKRIIVKTEKEEKVHYDSVLPATAAQMRIYTSQMMSVESVHYNIVAAFETDELDVERLEKAVNGLVLRHEGLRTGFENRNGEIVQIINDNAIIEIEELNNEDVTVFNTAFDLSKAPLFKVGYYENIVVVVAHHIIVDGESMTVLCKELNELYMGRELPETVQYGEFATTDNYTEADEKYWLNVFGEEINETDLPTDYPRPEKSSFKGTNIDAEIDKELNEKILNKCRQLGITSYAYYMACYNILLSKFSNNEDICVGMPISGRTSKYLNTVGMFVNTVVLRTNTEGNKTIKEFMQEVRENSISAITHQKYPYGELVKKLNKQISNRNPLFDVMFSYQNEAIPVIIFGDKESKSHPFPMNGAKCDLNFNIIPTRDIVNVSVEYSTDLYKEETINKFIEAYKSILEQCLCETKQIKDLTVLTEKEKAKLLKDFNDTAHKYNIPNNTTLYSLFEKKSEENKEKVCIIANDEEITFKDFKAYAERLDSKVRNITNSEKSVIAVICERSFEMYGAVYGIIRGGNAYLPIDPNYPQDRIDYILSNSNAKAVIAQDKFCHLAGNTVCINATEVLNSTEQPEKTEILANENDTAYVIYTSGSTGNPKGAKINHKSAINRILWMHDFYPLEENDVILQKTPYTFDVSVWELFWWGITGRTLCASKPDEHFLPAKILDETEKNKVTHLHFVPSVFDLFLTYLENNPEEQSKFNTVKYVFLSGEALTANSINRFYKMYDYNKVSLHNLYGPTECAVDVSYYPCVPTDVDPVPIGKPIYNTQLHIVDKYLNPTPIGVTGELCIAGVNVGQGYLNNEELTNEKFIDNPFGEGKLYKTGDLAYWREDGQICYVGRNDFQVKINGQRIELGEIENAISGIDGVVQCAVIVKEQYICAYYTGTEKEVKEMRAELSTKLPRYMVPHSFTHLESLPMTVSGKLDRKALPEIDLTNISAETEYVAPTTEQEKVLAEVITLVLNVEKVNMVDSFFDMGGDSLKAIELAAGLEDKGYTVVVKSIFEAKDIQSLAKEITVKTEKEEKIHYDSVLPATAAQMRVYTSQMMSPQSTHYNINYVFKAENVDKEKLEKAINELISRHESLRIHFETINGVVHQVIDEKSNIAVEDISEGINNFVRPFDLNFCPLMRVGCNKDTVIIDLHHIIVDGESMPVFFRELNELYMGRELPNTVQYGEFAVTDSYTEENEKYWLNMFSEEIAELELPTDYPRGETPSFKGTNLYTFNDKALHNQIEEFCKEQGITPFVYYMACFSVLLSKFSNNEDICVGTPVSGRTSKFLNTVGMFVNTIALRTNTNGNKTISALMQEIRKNSISAIDNQNYPFNELVKKLNISSAIRNPLFDVMFSYQSENMTDITFGDKKVELLPATTTSAKSELSFFILPRKYDVVLTVEYSTDLYKEKTVNKFINAYTSILTQALDETKFIKDITVLTDEERETILKDFNNTKAEYSKEKCIHELFEEQTERTPDKIALVATDKKVTYKALNEEANRIANNLISKGLGKGDIVGIKLSRTSKYLVSVLGVLKTGAAYLPLDPTHPQERIEYILTDSNAKFCIAEETFDELLNSDNTENPNIKVSGDNICYCIYTSGSTGKPKGAMIQHKNLCWYMSSLMSIYGKDDICMPFFTSQSVDLSVTSVFLPLMTGGTTYFYDNELLNNLSDIFNNEEINIIKLTPTHIQIIQQHIKEKTLNNLKHLIVGGEQLYRTTCIDFLEKFGTHIKIHNEYGPTETTVGCGDYVFNYEDTESAVSIGHPTNNVQMYIVDKNTKLLPIGVTGELCIAGDGVCAGYLNNEELTNEKFIDNPFGEGKLYKTGDLAYWREDGQICYVGRNDFQVKINGQRIELGEIENAIGGIDGVVQCAVIVKEQYICAYYTGTEKEVKEMRAELSTKLPRYMVPHSFTHLEGLPMTVSGKLDRKALPEIDIENISTETEIVLPHTEEEKALAEVISSVLRTEKVNMLDNFFNVGGDSITAIYVVSELEEKGYELHVADIMQRDTLSDIAKAMKSNSNKAIYDQCEVNGFIPFSPIMRAYLKEKKDIEKDFVHTCVLSTECNESIVKKAMDILVSHHDMLRGVFAENGIEVLPSNERKVYSFNTISINDNEEAIKYLKNVTLDDKLVKIVFCKTAKENLVSITVHHFLIDLVSWEVLIKDFNTITKQISNNEKISLPAKTASFKLWNLELTKYSEARENEEYWKSINEKLSDTATLSFNEENEAEEYNITLTKEGSEKIVNDINNKYGTRTNEVLLTAVGLAARRLARGIVSVAVESHGRAELNNPIAVERTIGWFTSCYPIVINNSSNAAEELIATKETMRRIPRNGVEYLLLNDGFHKNTDIIFNFFKTSLAEEKRDEQTIEFAGASVFPNKINVSCFEMDGVLTINVTVSKCNHKANICKELGLEIQKQIENLVEICTETEEVVKTRSDFSDNELTDVELDELRDLFD